MKILYPPHPHIRIFKNKLDNYESDGKWIAQRKFNGTNVVVNISKYGDIGILTRHGTAPKLFSLSRSHIEQINSLNFEKGKEYWLNGELLDHKTKNPAYKKKIVFFDVLYAGNYLVRKMNQDQRLQLLSSICKDAKNTENEIATKCTKDIWMAESWNQDFKYHFEEFIDRDEIEGLILRRKDSFIDNFGFKAHDVNWMVKCRKPHSGGNYEF